MCEGRINYKISCLLPKNRWILVDRKAGAAFWRELLGHSSRNLAGRTICLSEPLRASTRVSSGFALFGNYLSCTSKFLAPLWFLSKKGKYCTSRTSTAHDTQALEICLRSTLLAHMLISSVDRLAMWSRDFHKMAFKAEIVSISLMVTLVCATVSPLRSSTTPFCLKMISKVLTGLPET